jgi:uncharacterized protein YaaN involved in tellurite resistance
MNTPTNAVAAAPAIASAPLQIATMEEIKRDLGVAAAAPESAESRELDAKADQFVEALLAIDPKDFKARKDYVTAAENMGIELQKQAAKKSEILKQQIGKIAKDEGDGGNVANSLVDLKMQVEDLDPSRMDLDPGWFSRTLGLIPGVGTPLKRYFTKFESAQTVIAAIVRSLELGRDQLARDNVNLVDDQKAMYELTQKLEKAIQLAQRIDHKLDAKLKAMTPGTEQHQFVAEELLFPLRQRIIDLQQQMVVNQQGVLVTEGIIRNNKELVRGVNRTLHVTVSALNVGAALAIALANQKNVLEKVESVNKTTSDLIAGTAERLKTQGAAIHKQAASASLDIEKLKQAFADIKIAMDDIATFRQNALPQMAQSVIELDQISAEASAQIEKLNRGNQMRPGVTIDIG